MDKIFIIMNFFFSNMCIGIYDRSQVRVYRTIGPLVIIRARN